MTKRQALTVLGTEGYLCVNTHDILVDRYKWANHQGRITAAPVMMIQSQQAEWLGNYPRRSLLECDEILNRFLSKGRSRKPIEA